MTDFRIVTLVCSPRKRPAVHTGRAGGNQWWSRDTFHVADATGKKTVCGRKCEDWITIERRSVSRVHFRSTGVWWVTYYTTGFGSTRLYRWPWA